MQRRIVEATELASTPSYAKSFLRLRTWAFWRNMLVYFCVFSIVGHLIEWPYCAIGAACFNSVDWGAEVLANPLKPFMVYGIGIILCAVFLSPLKDILIRKMPSVWVAVLVFFLLGTLLGMAMELGQGFLQNQPDEYGNYPLWDVHDYPGNILGQAWIVNDLGLGAIFTFVTWHVFPLCEYRMAQLSERHANFNVAVICVAFIAITLLTYGFFG